MGCWFRDGEFWIDWFCGISSGEGNVVGTGKIGCWSETLFVFESFWSEKCTCVESTAEGKLSPLVYAWERDSLLLFKKSDMTGKVDN